MSHRAFFEVWNLRISGTAQIFQKSRTHLKTLGARRVKWRQTPYWGATNINRHCNKSSQHGDQAPTTCAHLDVSRKEQFCSHLSANTEGVQYKQWLHNAVSRNNRFFLCETYEMHTFTVWQNAQILIFKYNKIPLIRLARDRTGAEQKKKKNAGLSHCTCTDLSSKRHFFCNDPTLEV